MNPLLPDAGATRRRLLAALGLLPAAGLAATAGLAHGPSWGVHGMVLFGGRDGLFASHMPMFHRPHDVQAVLQLRAADPARERQLRAWLARAPVPWTIVPAPFELDDLAPGAPRPVTQLEADVVRGHFERGGRTQAKAVGFAVERVLAWRRLDPLALRPAFATYRLVAANPGATERFAVLEIGPRPAADHIVALSAPAGAALPDTVRVPADDGPGATPAALERALPGARVRATVYRETADLQ